MMEQFNGLVVRSTGSWYEVRTDDGIIRECRIRGKLRLKGVRSTNPVVVGDIVTCEIDATGYCVIVDITPRRNYIIRRASNLSKESHIIAANIDRHSGIGTTHHTPQSYSARKCCDNMRHHIQQPAQPHHFGL
jgi:ribosome biogenesis GTPase